jgi:hypothetical protein
VTRKIPIRDGAAVRELIEQMRAEASEAGQGPVPSIGTNLIDAVDALSDATEWLFAHGAGTRDPMDALAGATPYLRLFGTVIGGYLLARQAAVATRLLDTGGNGFDNDFLRAKVATAKFYAEQLLPQARGLLGAVTAGHADLYAVEAKYLTGG